MSDKSEVRVTRINLSSQWFPYLEDFYGFEIPFEMKRRLNVLETKLVLFVVEAPSDVKRTLAPTTHIHGARLTYEQVVHRPLYREILQLSTETLKRMKDRD